MIVIRFNNFCRWTQECWIRVTTFLKEPIKNGLVLRDSIKVNEIDGKDRGR
jgi:hypothetical protein